MLRNSRAVFGALLSISSLITSDAAIIEKRAVVIPSPLPGTWVSQGCYTEASGVRTLSGGSYTDDVAMTDESCINYCQNKGFIYAGTEFSSQCWCGNSIAPGAASVASTQCSMGCSGNATEACGGPDRLNIFWSGTTGPQTNSGPGLWRFAGCYTEGITGRALPNGAGVPGGSTNMTVTNCLTACQTANYILGGVEYSGECYCGNAILNGATLAPNGVSECNMLCNGNSSEFCGAGGRLDIYNFNLTASSSTSSVSTSSGTASASVSVSITVTSSSASSTSTKPVPTGPSNLDSVGPYNYLGCYTEGTNARALAAEATADDAMTVEICEAYCASFTPDYTYFGIEYGRECYCGNSFSAGAVLTAATQCNMLCGGDVYEYCGAGNRLSVYALNGTVTSTSTSATGTATGTSSTSSAPAATGYPAGWTAQGCWVDGLNGRILTHQQTDDQENTLISCVATCAAAGYTIAGAEYGVQCFCDNAIYNGGALAANQADCSVVCPGDPTVKCGGGDRISMVSKGTPPVYQAPGPQTTGLPTGWEYQGCLQDNIASNEDANQKLSTFPYKIWDNGTSNDAVTCIAQCQKFGYNAAGLEYGSQCFCGDVENINVASAPSASSDPDMPQYFTRSTHPVTYLDSQCDSPCPGFPQYRCGSGDRLTWYSYTASPPLYSWDIPTGEAAGEYSQLIGGVIVPLIVSQTVNGKVSFVEKFGTGEPNGTGAYELDLSLVPTPESYRTAWRQMNGLKTDVFCAAGLTLPDKAGRQLTAGGWAGESNFGVRLYWPDGSDGVNGTNDWIEDQSQISLQVARWYPSGMIMANGSILIVGGEIGQNDIEQPTLEILPATGVPDASTSSGYSNTTVYLDFLQRTWPFNLYPFICVVPSGIFIAYYNEARILNEATFDTIKELPNMPGSVDDPKAGRTYQLEGAMVLLPQHAPYTEKLGVLICGGSTEAGHNAIDNCVSTQPEADNPTWTIERMPSRRVLPCMAGLPDGTYVILNGGQHGVAGFGLAGSPNYNAVLYDPSKPVNQRMSIMANTTVARLYHSEATVLLDGRVLVTGSDPTGDSKNPAGSFPEEYRVEVFTPPYLLTGAARPAFTIVNKDWAYGQTVSFTITAGTATVVSLLGSVVSTHGNAMGQRTIFPAFTCAGNTCTVTAPPDAHTSPPGWFMMFVLQNGIPSVGVFVRIGGDPAELGNWPAVPEFAPLPGV